MVLKSTATSVAPPSAQLKVEETEGYMLLEEWLRERVGISFSSGRLGILKVRVNPRLTALGLKSIEEYLRYLQFHPRRQDEFGQLLSRLTNNETYFFREKLQLEAAAKSLIPQLAVRAGLANPVKILSAACSSGEEPVSILASLADVDFNLLEKVQVTAIDIDIEILDRARKGIYSDHSFRGVDSALVRRHFTVDGSNKVPRDYLHDPIQFRWGNLVDAQTLGPVNRYDIVFCRNVMIYFDGDTKAKVARHLYNVIKPGGLLLVGLSESLSQIAYEFEPERVDGVVIYRKQK